MWQTHNPRCEQCACVFLNDNGGFRHTRAAMFVQTSEHLWPPKKKQLPIIVCTLRMYVCVYVRSPSCFFLTCVCTLWFVFSHHGCGVRNGHFCDADSFLAGFPAWRSSANYVFVSTCKCICLLTALTYSLAVFFTEADTHVRIPSTLYVPTCTVRRYKYMYVCTQACMYVCISVCLSFCMYIHTYVCLFVGLSVCRSVCLSAYVSVGRSVCMYVFTYICMKYECTVRIYCMYCTGCTHLHTLCTYSI